MITITTINNSYYFIGNLVIQPNNSAVVDETILSYQNLRDIVLAEQNKRITLSNTDLNAVKSEMNAKDGKIDESSFKTINGESIIGSGDLVLAGGSVDSVQGRTGVVVINKADVGLSDVNNTSDLSKPISTAQQTALNLKANSSHTHVISEVTNLTTELNSLSGSDILSGAILGNNLVLTLKNNNTINIDVTQFVEDLTVVSGAYDPLTESIIFELSDLSTFSVPVSALLPVTTDGLTIQGNGGSTSLSVKIDTGLNNRIIIGAGGLRTDSILSNTTESYTTSDKNLVNDIPDIKNDILTKQNTLIPGANIDITGDTISVVGLGSGTTNLSVNRSNTAVTIVSDTGADAIIAPATSSLAGVMVASDKVKLDGIQTNATANSTDSFLLDRNNHTGTQLSSTISDFNTNVDSRINSRIQDQIVDGVTLNAPSQNAVFDALSNKSNLGHNHSIAEITNLQTTLDNKSNNDHIHTSISITDFDVAVRTAVVEDQIIDGVINKAPSQNSVFDALANKANSIHTHSTSQITDFNASVDSRINTRISNTSIDELNDVNTTNKSNGQVLTYNTVTSQWSPATPIVYGDMFKSTYDTNDNGVIDNSERLNNQLPTYYLSRSNHTGTQSAATITGLTSASVGLGNVDNTSDANKPISTATQTALNGKSDNGHAHAIADVTGLQTALNSKEATVTAGTTAQYYRGDKSWQTLDGTAVGLGAVVNQDTTTTANITDSTNKRFVSDAQLTVIGNTSNTNTGDETQATIKTKLGAATTLVDGYLTSTNFNTFNDKEPALAAGTTAQYYRGDKSWQTLNKASVGLTNADDTSDANKPISTATQTALNGKEGTITPGTTAQYYRGDKSWQTLNSAVVGLGNADNTSDANKPISTATQTALNGKEAAIAAGTTGQYWRGDKSFQTLDKSAVGLGNVDNTSDANKPVSTAQATADGVVLSSAQSYADGKVIDSIANADTTHAPSRNAVFDALALKQDSLGFTPEDSANKQSDLTASATKYPTVNAVNTGLSGKEPTITSGTTGQYWRGDKSWQTLDKTAVGLGNVDNTSDASKPISTLTQTALNAKEGTITAGTTGQYYRGDKSFQTLNSAAVGLGSVANVDTTNAANITSGLLPLGRLEVPLQLLSDATFNNDTVLMYTNNRFDSLPLTSSEDNMLFNYSGSGLNINAKYGNHPNNPYFSFMEHFIGTSATSTVSPYFLRTVNNGTTAALYLSSDTDTRMGVLRLGAGALLTSGAALGTSGMQSFNFAAIPNGGYYETGCGFQLPTLSDANQTFSLVFGFGDATTAQPVDGVFLRHTTNTVVGRLVANSVITDIAIPNITNLEINTNYILKIRVSRDNSGVLSATFKLNGNEVTTSSGIPTGVARQTALQYAIIKSNGVIDRFVDLDWIYFERYFPEISNY